MSTSIPIITGGNAPVTVTLGEISFYDRFAPPLQTGHYSVSAKQEVQGVSDINDGMKPIYEVPAQNILVTGPRFSLSSRDVFSMYPPADSQGTFTNHLPHVVLSQRSFPWVRDIVDEEANATPSPVPPPSTPWIALLTFYSAEIQRPQDPVNPNPSGPVAPPKTMNVPDIIAASSTVLTPQIKLNAGESELQAQVVEMDYAFFKGIAPSQTDLPYLAHGRQVNTDNKAVVGEQAKGYFSLSVGNRALRQGDQQTAVLVSLEGHWDRLPGGTDASKAENNGKKIRLVVLASWSFTTLPSGGDFLYLMKHLNVDLLRLAGGNITLGPPDTDPTAQAVEALALGYVPLAHDLRNGETTTSYYRGPGAAAMCATDVNKAAYYHSDSAIHYDPTFGTFNLSYAAAFQVGRLLGMSDSTFCADLVQWRNDYFYRMQNAATNAAVNVPVAAAVAAVSGMPVAQQEQFGPVDEVHSTVRHLFGGALGNSLLRQQQPVPLVTPRHLRAAASETPGILTEEEIEDLHASGDDPLAAIRQKIAAAIQSNDP